MIQYLVFQLEDTCMCEFIEIEMAYIPVEATNPQTQRAAYNNMIAISLIRDNGDDVRLV